MKQFLLPLAMLLALPVKADIPTFETPYRSTLCEDEAWTVVNINPDSKEWEDSWDFSKSGYDEGKCYSYDRKNDADDWLISPGIMLKSGKEYKVMFTAKSTGEYEQFRLTMANDTTIASLSHPEAVLWEYDGNSTGWEKISCVLHPEKDETVYFGIHAYSEADGNKIYVTGFEVKENVFKPAGVSEFAVIPDPECALRAELSWILPTHDVDNSPIPEDAVFNKVSLWRDGQFLVELNGDAVSYFDSETTGLTAGKHTYAVSVTVNGVESAKEEVTSRYIGPIAAKDLPWTADVASLSADTFETEYLVIKG